MWSALRHPNVSPFLGVTMTGTQYVMVSEWMTNGNINEFVKVHPDADQLKLVSLPFDALLYQFADDHLASIAERRRQGAGLFTWPGIDPRRSKRGASFNPQSLC